MALDISKLVKLLPFKEYVHFVSDLKYTVDFAKKVYTQ